MADGTELVNLGNFASKVPTWAPDLANHLYALVDMGSNGIRFSISDLSPPCARLMKCVYRERAALSLFDALNESPTHDAPTFSSDVIIRVSQTLARFKAIAVEFGVPLSHISVFATEAMRKADNASSMLEAIRSKSEVEVLFGSMGARSGFDQVAGLFLDLGGGSVQARTPSSGFLRYSSFRAARAGMSLPFGAAKLNHVLSQSDTTAVQDLKTGMRSAFAALQREFPSLREALLEPAGRGIDVYLCGGGFRGYGSILMHGTDSTHPYPIPAVGAYTVDGSVFRQTASMRKVNAEFDGKIFGMSKRRRAQFPAIATVVEALIDTVPRIRTVTFSGGGNREGALLLMLPPSIRESSPLPLLHHTSGAIPANVESITKAIQSALPPTTDFSPSLTVFTLGLGPLFVSEIWSRMGEPSEANAAFQLHQSVTREPSVPGFTHLARSILGLTLCFRWGATVETLGPVDRQLFRSLYHLVCTADPQAVFWAEWYVYIGTVARVLSSICPIPPRTSAKLVQFNARIVEAKELRELELTVTLSHSLFETVDSDDVVAAFKNLGKLDGSGQARKKIKVVVLVKVSKVIGN
ncbi:Ppx/GppA phosphatase family-domain-containing protein [Xylariaceae sp. FL1272]|nr:Ppx/GppA phosphatase family-domain-containing protein [Xylariaceae sp. FL1272]